VWIVADTWPTDDRGESKMNTKKARQEEIRRLSARVPRLIEWSDEDGCYVGSAPPLQDVIDGKMPAPKGEAGKIYSGKFAGAHPRGLAQEDRSQGPITW
jgi:hypothetical protein